MRLAHAADPEAARTMRHAVADFAAEHGAAHRLAMDIALAVSEAVTNVIVHAYRDAHQPGVVIVAAERDGGFLHVLVSDEGTGMRPRTDSPGIGAGLPLIERIAQSLIVSTADGNGGADVRMTFDLAA
jgi:anti-sigma regulatory factor (Ser/Thr protein kinase)